MIKLDNLPLYNIDETDREIIFTFVQDDNGEEIAREIIWRTKRYNPNTKEWEDDKTIDENIEKWSKEYFNVPRKKLNSVIGTTKDVYVYDSFDSLWEVETKFTEDDVNQIKKGEITEITTDNKGIYIYFKTKDGNKRRANMRFEQKVGDKFLISPRKKRNALENFKKSFGVDLEDKDTLVGKTIMVQIAKAFNIVYPKILGLAE